MVATRMAEAGAEGDEEAKEGDLAGAEASQVVLRGGAKAPTPMECKRRRDLSTKA